MFSRFFCRCMHWPTCMKNWQNLSIASVCILSKWFFDILMHFLKINFFVEGVRKWPRADSSKISRKWLTKSVIFQVFRPFWACGNCCLSSQVRECNFRPFFILLKGRDNHISNCNVGSKPLKEFSDRCMLKGIASISVDKNVSKFDTT